jgi:hypothetical protein
MYGENATAHIFTSFPRDDLSKTTGFFDIVSDIIQINVYFFPKDIYTLTIINFPCHNLQHTLKFIAQIFKVILLAGWEWDLCRTHTV